MSRIVLTPAGLAELPGRVRRRWSAERSRRRLERDFTALMKTRDEVPRAAVLPADRLTIGFATFGSGCWHLALEALLAHALLQRGASAQLLLCDVPALPVCDERTTLLRDPLRCPGCIDEKRRLLETSTLTWRGLNDFIPPDALEKAGHIVGGLADEQLGGFEHGGWPLGAWTYVSACHFLRADARTRTPESITVRRRLLTTAIVVTAAVERWLDDLRPDVVIAESGAHLVWRIAFELARARGIRVVCREIGKGGWDSHIYSLNAECMFPRLDDVWARARQVPLPPAEADRVEKYMSGLPGKTYRAATAPRVEDASVTARALALDVGQPVVALFTNVAWDLATAGRDVGFDGMYDWIFETLRVASQAREVQFVIRVHPAENSVLTRERVVDRLAASFERLPPNVRLITADNPIAVRSVCEVADVVAVYCSTAGIEAAIAGKPVLLCGAPHYRHRGFTIDIAGREEYAAALQSVARGSAITPPDESAELARRYAHLFFLRYHLDMGWTTSPLEPPYRLTIRHLSELRPGRNRAVDTVCDGILAGREILLPAWDQPRRSLPSAGDSLS